MVGVEILAALLSGALSLSFGGLLSNDLIRRVLKKLLKLPEPSPVATHRERLANLTESLARASAEVDAVLGELAKVARDREEAISNLEAELGALEAKERALQQRINDLQNVPLPVAEHFAALTESGEKRSARRDYLLFGAGVLVSTSISIILYLIGLA